jgi:cobalt-zinc-cadmium efflux system membrane fusion protein
MKNFLATIFLLALVSCGSKTTVEEPRTEAPAISVSLSPEQIQHAKIETGRAEKGNVSSTLKLSGAIDVPPQNTVSVSFPLGGYLKSTKLLPGMKVQKGETLAIMEDAQYITLQQDYLITQSKLDLATAEYQRQQALQADKASSDKLLQQAKNDYETQRITLRALAEKLRLIGIDPTQLREDNISRTVSLRAPIAGYVSKIGVNPGKYTAPEDVLFELLNLEDLHLQLMVFEKDISHLSVGQKVLAFTSDQPELKQEARIILIGKDLDENRSAEVHCHFTKPNQKLLPGMFMNAEVNIETADAWLVPEEAVVRWQNKYYLFVETAPGAFDMEPVELGIAQGGKQQVLINDSLANKNIAIKNAYSLLMKLKNNADE